LDKIDGEEAFADTAFAVEDEVETFHGFCGLSIRTCAMRGPCDFTGTLGGGSGQGIGSTGG
jgi:hypothetical protein